MMFVRRFLQVEFLIVAELYAARYQAQMLRSLKEVNADDTIVGFYQTTSMGAFYQQSLVDQLVSHQDKLRHGGVAVVHGTHSPLQDLRFLRECL